MSQFFALGDQSIGVAVPMNIQDWFPLGLTGLISVQAKGLSRVSDLRESLSLLLKGSPA